jgi:hypothetical protein
MLFPSTQTNFKIRRLPWLSFALVCLSGFVFLALPADLTAPGGQPRDAQADAAFFWRDHAYLGANSEIVERIERDIKETQRRPLILAAIRELGWRSMPSDAARRSEQRAELDRLIVRSRIPDNQHNPLPDDHPFRQYGFTPATPSLLGAFTHGLLYAGWFHFLSSAGLLFFLAASLEDRWGPGAVAVFFTLSALLSAGLYARLESINGQSRTLATMRRPSSWIRFRCSSSRKLSA